jgi:DNA (cytosine-5)-methyltransferase 1
MRQNNGTTVYNNLVTRNSSLIIARYKHIPQGGNWKSIPSNLFHNYKNPKNCHGSIYYRLKWDDSSVVLSNFRKSMLIHPEYDRGLSIREAARLQSFPDNFIFYGRLDFQQQLVADAVPPNLARIIGENIICYLKEIVGK